MAASDPQSPPPPLPSGEGRGEGKAENKKQHRRSTLKARKLRYQATDAENLLWQHLRARQLSGHKFRRQHPIGKYIADFACIEKMLIVELDGGQHTAEKDDNRTHWLESQGYTIIRYWNHEVLTNIEGLLQSLTLTLSHRERETAENT